MGGGDGGWVREVGEEEVGEGEIGEGKVGEGRVEVWEGERVVG